MSSERGAWRARAACAGADPQLFTADSIRPIDVRAAVTAAARQFCATCPVVAECGAEADAHDDVGLWGGVHRHLDLSRTRRLTCTPLIPIHPTTPCEVSA